MAPTGRLAALPLEAVQTPTVTGTAAPVLSAAVAVQVALVAAAGPALVQTMLPATAEPGALTGGRPLKAGVMSAAAPVTVSVAVSQVAANPVVREVLVGRQRAWVAERGGGVVEGRDIGSVVFPDAELKLYLTASPRVRATCGQCSTASQMTQPDNRRTQ